MMPEREKLAAGLGCAAWGYFLLLFNFEINGFNLLPEFLGYALFFWALEHFAGTGPDWAGLKSLCLFLLIYNLLNYVQIIDALPVGMFVIILAAVAQIYFHFQFLSGVAELAASEAADEKLVGKFFGWRTVYVVLMTGLCVLLYFFNGDFDSWLVWPVLLLGFAVMVAEFWLMLALFKLRKILRKEAKLPIE
ncbi:MAG: hypothetical protein HFJ96_00045 [Peptococcaceae bacterium]|jgi:hypothetical protein|nr:hypothetical protein [Peptococcaceae bacterium]